MPPSTQREKMTKKPNTPLGPRLLSLKQAAVFLGLSLWAMRERIWAGEIPVIRFPGGRKLYIDVNDLEDFVTKNKTILT